jgi:chromate reductase
MKIVAIVGSIRANSYNKQLAYTIQERFSNLFELEIANIQALPFYNQDEENDPIEVVKSFKKTIAEADGVIIITPEYNWSIPGVLKNALDWLSRGDKELANKPVMVAGASMGMLGTIRAQIHLRDILLSAGHKVNLLMPGSNEFLIPAAHTKFDPETQRLVDEPTLQFLDQVIQRFIALAQSSR